MPLLNVDERVLIVDVTGAAMGTSSNPIFTAAAASPGTTNVQGVQAAGAAITENPVLVAGENGGNVKLPHYDSLGTQWVIGGHVDLVTIRANYTAAQTDTAIVSVSAGTRIVVTGFMVTNSNATTLNVSVVLGFGTVNTPTTTGVIGAHSGIAPGSGFGRGGGSGIIGFGASDEDLRITSSVPTSGSIDVTVTYYTIATAGL